MQYRFDHENLDCYRLAVEVVRWLNLTTFPRGQQAMRDQAVRAAGSVVLNIAEGRARGGDAGRNHFRIALGSAAETCAVLDVVTLPDGADAQAKLRRVGAMLARLDR